MSLSHLAFSDDSSHQDGRYNSLSLVSLKKNEQKDLNSELECILSDSGISSEFKWSKVNDAKYRLAAKKLVDFVFKQANNSLRIDTIIWDLSDYRHEGVVGRDDNENLVRMYYHLTSTTLSKRWPIKNTQWTWKPDVQSSVDWSTLQDCIKNKKHNCTQDLFEDNPEFAEVNLENIEPSDSKNHPLIQLADLFAGMGAYSYGHFEKYQSWKEQNETQTSMFNDNNEDFSNSEEERFKVMKDFNNKCKDNKLQIAFESKEGFYSHDPSKFINFWLYTPQHSEDKAPTN